MEEDPLYEVLDKVHPHRAAIEAALVERERRLVKPDKINQAIGRLKERYPRVARYFDFSYDPDTATLAAPEPFLMRGKRLSIFERAPWSNKKHF